jgi:hypothetical protein
MKNMKHLKTFEAKQSKEDQIELLKDLLMENPQYETHDFYIFIGRNDFKEEKDGRYKKTIEIENMVKITPDENSLGAMAGLDMRARFQTDSKIYHIWLPKELEDEVAGKGSNRIEPWLVDLIDKHKGSGADEQGKAIYKKVSSRKSDAERYNI